MGFIKENALIAAYMVGLITVMRAVVWAFGVPDASALTVATYLAAGTHITLCIYSHLAEKLEGKT